MMRYTIYLTEQCNCRCVYCYQTSYEIAYTWEEIKVQLDMIIQDGKQDKIIEFIGGEPLLAFDMLVKACNYLENNLNRITVLRYYISTNLTILNKNIIDFLRKNDNIFVSVSLDGNREMNKLRLWKNGKENYFTVVKNIKKLIKSNLNDRLMVHMVCHKNNVDNLYKGVKFLNRLGVKAIDIGIVENTMPIDKSFCNSFINEHEKISLDKKKGKLTSVISTLDYEPISLESLSEKDSTYLIYYLRNYVYKNHINTEQEA
ncbi:MAG: radical SAM protein [Clostridiaceae bacterium]